jgi:hypothetical protein
MNAGVLGPAVGAEHHVPRLHVAVHHGCAVEVREPPGHVSRERAHGWLAQAGPAPRRLVRQRAARRELEEEMVLPPCRAEAEAAEHVR